MDMFTMLFYSAMVRVAKTAYVYFRFNDKPSMPTNASLDLVVEGVGIEPTQNTGLQPVALPTELTFHMEAGVRVILHYIKIMFYEVFKMSQKLSEE